MTKVERLEKRLGLLSGAGNVWIPSWLSALASQEELVEWTVIHQTPRGREDKAERVLEFQRQMRLKYGSAVALTIEEEMMQGVARLEANPWLRWREGLHDDPVVDKIMRQLSHDEVFHLSKAILAFDKADAAPDAVLTSSSETLADLPAEQRAVIEKVRHLSREKAHSANLDEARSSVRM